MVHTGEHPVIGDSKGRLEHGLIYHLNKRTINLWEGGNPKGKGFWVSGVQTAGS